MAIAYAPIVLSTDFIDACVGSKTKELPNISKFLLKDHDNEEKFGTQLKEILKRAKTNGHRLLSRTPVYCTKDITNGPDTYMPIVQANGGIFGVYTGKPVLKKVNPEDDTDIPEPVYLISGLSPKEKSLWEGFTKMAEASNMIPRIVTTEWLLDLALTQEDHWNDEFLAKNQKS